jgi:hypothetical protein
MVPLLTMHGTSLTMFSRDFNVDVIIESILDVNFRSHYMCFVSYTSRLLLYLVI